jgi:hypothetical protein
MSMGNVVSMPFPPGKNRRETESQKFLRSEGSDIKVDPGVF